MTAKGFKRSFPAFKIISENEVEAIHRATLQVLWETGATFHHEQALKLFAESGCKVDFETHRVRFPPWLVEQVLAKCPKTWRVKARNPEQDLIFQGGGDVTYIAPGIGMASLDLETWAPKALSRQEFYEYMKVLDGLPNAAFMSCFPLFGFATVPECMLLVEANAGKIRCSSKAQMEGSILDNYKWNIKMAKAVGADLLNLLNPAAPLTFYPDTAQMIYDCVAEDAPFHFATGPVAGSSGPATIVGSIVTNNAEALAGMCLAQLLHPGHRVWAGNMMMVQNMRTGSPAFGAIENTIGEVVFTQMWRHYEIPSWSSTCDWSDSKMIDYQAGYELSMAAIICASAGATMMFFQGGLTAELTAHHYKAVIDDDVAGMIGRFLRGATVNDDTLAVDVINAVGPIPGYFLNTAHTREWWKKEQFVPRTADRLSYEVWVQQGKKTVLDHGKEVYDQILASHKPEMLTPEQETAVEDVLQEARNYYRKKGQISDADWVSYMKTVESPTYPFA